MAVAALDGDVIGGGIDVEGIQERPGGNRRGIEAVGIHAAHASEIVGFQRAGRRCQTQDLETAIAASTNGHRRQGNEPVELHTAATLTANPPPWGRGYHLARPATQITLLHIVEAAEGPATFDHCVLKGGPCDWEHACPVHDTWTRAQNALETELSSTTLADLARIDAAIEAGTHQPDTPPHPHPTERHGQRDTDTPANQTRHPTIT